MKSMYDDGTPQMKMGPEYMIYPSQLNNQVYVNTSHDVSAQSFSISNASKSKHKAKK